MRKLRSLFFKLITKTYGTFGILLIPAPERRLIRRIKKERLTYLSVAKLLSITKHCKYVERAQVPGTFVESGCAGGGSAILIGSIKSENRLLAVYDVFGMIPPPTERDPVEVHERYRAISEGRATGIDGGRYYGYEENLYRVVEANFERYGLSPHEKNISLIQGYVEDTLVLDQPVSFAHIDVDWFQPVKTCLERIWPRLERGGRVIIDDYYDWGGCRTATDEFLAQITNRVKLSRHSGALVIIKTSE